MNTFSTIRRVFRSRSGFTLIELMIVVMILAILGSFAIPLYVNYKAGAMQSEARILLGGIWTGETAYYAEKSRFVVDNTVIGFNPLVEPKFYKNWDIFVYPAATCEHFIATCSTNLDMDVFLDSWYLDDSNKDPKNTFNDIQDKSL
jgi:prepilin-type N-terminal cleavage/methylation domain-containing protein